MHVDALIGHLHKHDACLSMQNKNVPQIHIKMFIYPCSMHSNGTIDVRIYVIVYVQNNVKS